MDESNIEHYPSEKNLTLENPKFGPNICMGCLASDLFLQTTNHRSISPNLTCLRLQLSIISIFTTTKHQTRHMLFVFFHVFYLFEILPTQQNKTTLWSSRCCQPNPLRWLPITFGLGCETHSWMPITIRIIGSTEHPNVSPGFLNYYESEVPKKSNKNAKGKCFRINSLRSSAAVKQGRF